MSGPTGRGRRVFRVVAAGRLSGGGRGGRGAPRRPRAARPAPGAQSRLPLRALMSAGEGVGETVFAWCRDAPGVVVNEMF
ncbi:hypothetical protein, partial [Phycicoccus sp.]|uniref:hypothetical protein n=1 Tax=Phycicoccus sp. TaxID=1902410 RepID=UPI002C987B4F